MKILVFDKYMKLHVTIILILGVVVLNIILGKILQIYEIDVSNTGFDVLLLLLNVLFLFYLILPSSVGDAFR